MAAMSEDEEELVRLATRALSSVKRARSDLRSQAGAVVAETLHELAKMMEGSDRQAARWPMPYELRDMATRIENDIIANF